ncbi:DNA polymerase/3'-5' exonuclease PolX [Streptomyces sp. RKND-216]|uniref:DNA polymerase/3'-5' exonuclease PolX n=1 Tax=Streptomyces sp. RKND-216 TaxID=2562581 RepID=UPI00109DF12B|nr:DNA polymerase/3'-5' exonuclease PolX [Streptomyces sp. RKND-216]THA27400.1 DNA polymerase/3'-5' exonuclease PolX [Streptomyces sp. RKND-216]
MARPNDDVAALLQEYADLVQISGGDAFKARAYEKAARAIGGHHTDVSTLDARALRDIPNVGRSIADKVAAYLTTGTMPEVEQVRARIPDGVRRLMAIPTLGPKKALTLYETLGISSVPALREAIEAERLRDLKGFGPKTEENILHGIDVVQASGGRVRLGQAAETAEAVVAALTAIAGCERCTWAGSLRRMRETVGDLDILVAARRSAPFMDALTRLPYVAETLAHGTKKTSVRTTDGLQIDLRVVPPGSWGAALIYFTGSKAHNIRIRERAVRHKLKLSEYGLFHAETGRKIAARTEEDVYRRLGLPWIPPTLREDRGEVAAALRGELPATVTDADIRGDLHTHTDLTDGLASLEDMVDAAARRGLEYYAVTDHAPDLVMQRMTDERALAQREAVRALGERHRGMRLLHGTELNIDPDGGVDWDAEFLAGFDVCVASVHSHFRQSRDALTRRLVRACENPHVHIIGHPTTRILGKREPVDADLDAVFAAAARTGTALEINSHPNRLDLNDENILRAKRHGVKFAIDTDAHSVRDLEYHRFGVGTAQRGWLTAEDVINTWPLPRLLRHLDGTGNTR